MTKGMQHLNGNLLVAVDVETTGLIPGYNEIYQVAILPLDSTIKPCRVTIPYYLDLAITRPENMDKKAIKMNKIDFAKRQQRAIDSFTAADMLDEWFDQLKLPIYKRLCPLAQNFPFDRSFLIEWLGIASYEHLFSPLYRDTLVNTLFHSDLSDFRGDKIKFVQHNLQYLCQKMDIKNLKAHDALQDCIAKEEVYRRLLLTY